MVFGALDGRIYTKTGGGVYTKIGPVLHVSQG